MSSANARQTRSQSRAGSEAVPSRIPAPRKGAQKGQDKVAEPAAAPETDGATVMETREAALQSERTESPSTGPESPLAEISRGRTRTGRRLEGEEDLTTTGNEQATPRAGRPTKSGLEMALQALQDRIIEVENRINWEQDQDEAEVIEDEPENLQNETMDKGKSIDPREWGALGIPAQELNTEVQRERLNTITQTVETGVPNEREYENDPSPAEIRMKEFYDAFIREKAIVEAQARNQSMRNGRISDSPMSKDMEDFIRGRSSIHASTPAARGRNANNSLLPSAQLDPTSILGRELLNTAKSNRTTRFMKNSMTQIDNNATSIYPHNRFRPLPPTTPTVYDGEEDSTLFSKYVNQCRRFVREAQLSPGEQVARCADYLSGKAYNFYSAMVSMEEHEWTLPDFFTGLYDYCFSPDYRLRMRRKLDNMRQGNMRVKEYAAEINLLFRTIGSATMDQKVDKLWNGLNIQLQTALWKEGLDYKTASWDEIIAVASRHEMADNMESRNRDYYGQRNGNSRYERGRHADKTVGEPLSKNRLDRPAAKDTQVGRGSHKEERDRTRDKTGRDNRMDRKAPSGVCYRCNQPGHFERHCPEAQEVQGGSQHRQKPTPASGMRPATLKSFNVNVITETEDQLTAGDGEAADEAEAFYMHVESAMCEPLTSEAEPDIDFIHYDDGASAVYGLDSDDGRMGHPLCDLITAELERAQPFPGDGKYTLDGPRFLTYMCSPTEMVVSDSITGDAVLLPVQLAKNVYFRAGVWYAVKRTQQTRARVSHPLAARWFQTRSINNPWLENALWRLATGSPFSLRCRNMRREASNRRFQARIDNDRILIIDTWIGQSFVLTETLLHNYWFNISVWFTRQVRHWLSEKYHKMLPYDGVAQMFEDTRAGRHDALEGPNSESSSDNGDSDLSETETMATSVRSSSHSSKERGIALELLGARPVEQALPSVQRNASITKDPSRIVPTPITVVVNIKGQQARALLDSGSLCDFMSSTLADQLRLTREELTTPLVVQLAVLGSRSKINYKVTTLFEYQKIREQRTFDVINLSNYDLILGTPFLFQHQVLLGFNDTRIIIGSNTALPVRGSAVKTLASRSAQLRALNLDEAREYLRQLALPLCQSAEQTALPPLRAINHRIELIDDDRVYPWRPARCPEAFMGQWTTKRNAYIESGRWMVTNARNVVPMMYIPKPGKEGEPAKLRTVIDLRARNDNMIKMASPLPDIDGIMRRVAARKYRSILDLKDAYEQVRVHPDDVWKTAFATPNGNMVSQVLQQGDANAPATYQSLMNHIFSAHIGIFLDVYLDDIVIYSDSLKEHLDHVSIVIKILTDERFYLSESKLHFLCSKVKILGRIVDDDGIMMDPHKVDALVKWKTPTNRGLLRGFLGAAGYLADDIAGVRIPMGVLHALTSEAVPFRWDFTHQRAFNEVKSLAYRCKDHHRRPLDLSPGALPINIVTDGCVTGIAGVVSQGDDWKSATVAAFYSAKLNPAQQNYPVHEIELLAGLETMMRHRDILLGVKFRWFTDHKGLVTVLHHKDVSGRRARWLENLSMFDFTVYYVPGEENILSDALSRIYSNDAPGTVRTAGEYTEYDDTTESMAEALSPVFVGLEACAVSNVNFVGRRSKRIQERPDAATGRPEYSDEFAARQRDGFRLKGPDPSKRLTITIPARGTGRREKTPATTDASITPAVDEPEEEDLVALPPAIDLTKGVDEIDILAAVKGKYATDPFFGHITAAIGEHKNFRWDTSQQLLYLVQGEVPLLCIPDTRVGNRTAREIIIAEGHTLLAHLGFRKTYDYLRTFVWWKTLLRDIESYCTSCVTCRRAKSSTTKPYGLLNPLEIQTQPWDAIGMDFVGPLPTSGNRDGDFDCITTIIDLFSGMVHLVPSRTDYTAKQVAELVFTEVYKHHGLPRIIVSDRDPLFTSHFWRELHTLIGTKLRMSSAFHPETDGATERANKTIGQMLRVCINSDQRNWVARLPAIEFAINSARSESTGFAPFFLNTGRVPRSFIWNKNEPVAFPGVRVFAQKLRTAIMSAHDCLIAARVKSIRNANRKRVKAPFRDGDLVYISTKNISIPKGMSRKLAPKYIGPYLITEDFGNFSFRVKLPPSLTRRGVHDVFHASLLRVHHPNDDSLFPGRLDNQVFDNNTLEGGAATVDKVIDHKKENGILMFHIVYKSGDSDWRPWTEVRHLIVIDQYLEAKGMVRPSDDTGVMVAGVEIYTDDVLATRRYNIMDINSTDAVNDPATDQDAVMSDHAADNNAGDSGAETTVAPSTGQQVATGSSALAGLHFTKTKNPIGRGDHRMVDFYQVLLPPNLSDCTLVAGFSRLFIGPRLTYYIQASDGQIYGVPMAHMKECLRFAAELSRTRTDLSRRVHGPEPLGYRILAYELNADPVQKAKLPIIDWDSNEVEFGNTTATNPYPLQVPYPGPDKVQKGLDMVDRLGDMDAGLISQVAMNAAVSKLKEDNARRRRGGPPNKKRRGM